MYGSAILLLACVLGRPSIGSAGDLQTYALKKIYDALPAASAEEERSRTLYWGIYLQGGKVGWMRQTLSLQGDVFGMITQMEAKVHGMGRNAHLALLEKRIFARQTGALQHLEFEQQGGSDTMRIQASVGRKGTGKDAQEGLDVTVDAGGSIAQRFVAMSKPKPSHRKGQEILQGLAAHLGSQILAQELGEGQSVPTQIAARYFDPTTQTFVLNRTQKISQQAKMAAGVMVSVVKTQTDYPELGITETSHIDPDGRVLSAEMGNFFLARLEPKAQAQKASYSQDVLLNAVVEAPIVMPNFKAWPAAKYTLVGLEASSIPLSHAQFVVPSDSKADSKAALEESHDAIQVIVKQESAPDPAWQAAQGPFRPAPKAALASEPFIQSDHPKIRKTAARIAGDLHGFAQVEALVEFVATSIKDRYQPGFSDAWTTLKQKTGDCTEHTLLFVALARALSIPARPVVGLVFWPKGGGLGWHAWAEVYFQGRWIRTDPTWGQPLADIGHIKLAEGSPKAQVRIVMLLGKLKWTGFQKADSLK